MAAGFLYKPDTSKGPVFLAPDSTPRTPPTITGSDGTVYNSRWLNTLEGNHQYVFDPGVTKLQGATLNYGGETTKLANGSQAYQGDSLDSLQARQNGSLSGGGGGSAAPQVPGSSGGGSTLGTANPFFDPNFPGFQNVKPNSVAFPSIKTAPYKPIDVTQFGQNFAKTNGALFGQNFDSAQGYALKSLDTELAGLKNYVPQSADLARGQIGLDNPFNQGERTAQIDSTLPGVRGALDAQAGRAATYASGQLPDSIQDRALELGIRSNAADTATAGGFGAGSGQSQKLSDLMSADQRLQIAQYGEGLVSSNINQKAGLELAPTEYSSAGSQVPIAPAVSADQIAGQQQGQLNNATLITPGQALSTAVQQSQFGTSLEENNRQFNATGQFAASQFNSAQALQADEFNSSGQFTAALGKFGYDTSFLNALQTANQGVLNNATGASVAGTNAGTFNAGLGAGQSAGTISSGLQAIGAVGAAVGGVSNILNPNTSVPQPGGGGGVGSGGSSGGSSSGTFSSPTPTGSSNPPPTVDTSGGSAGSFLPSASPSGSLGTDSSSPDALKFPVSSPIPSGYTGISNNGDGTISAIPNSAASAATEEMAKFANIPSSDVNLGSLVNADKSLTSATGLSFVPIKGFQPVGLTATGSNVYSLPAAASNGNINMGRDSVQNAALTMAALGVSDPKMFQAMGHVADLAGDPAVHAQLDKLAAEKGPQAVGQAIVNQMKSLGVSPKTKAGQQVMAGAKRLGELWDNLSPAQKSLGLSSLANPATESHSGKNPAEQVVPGTEKSVAGPLKVKDVMDFMSKGANGMSLARNWNDVSAIAHTIAGVSDPRGVAQIASKIGLAGFGPSGSAVPISAKQLMAAGAKAAPQFGNGAMKFASAGKVPQSYQIVSNTPSREAIAVPKNLSLTSPFVQSSPAPLVYKKGEQIAAGKHPAQKLWGKNPTGRVSKGSVGGSAVVSGLHVMHQTNPTMFSGVAAHAFFNNLIGKEQGDNQTPAAPNLGSGNQAGNQIGDSSGA